MVKATPETDSLTIEGLGVLNAAVARLRGGPAGHLVMARRGRRLLPEELSLFTAMARALGLAIRGLRADATRHTTRVKRERESEERARLLDALGTRQRLLETLLGVQRAIAARKPLQTILDAATSGAQRLLDQAEVALVLADEVSGELVVASSGAGGERPVDPMVMGAAAEAIDSRCLITRTGDGSTRAAAAGLTAGVRSVLAAPVAARGIPCGALTIDTFGAPGHVIEQRELLAAFAQQVDLAMTEARSTTEIHKANHDRGTGLPNRACFLDHLASAIERGHQRVSEVTVLVLDLNRFQFVNDSVGYRGGEEVLTQVAARITSRLRSDDLVARIGGDEFGVVIAGAGASVGTRVAHSLIEAIEEPFEVFGRTIRVSASVGVATSGISSGNAGDLVSNADVALSRAKRSRGHAVVVFEPHMHTEILERLNLLDDLHAATRSAGLRLAYQPIVRLGTGRPVGVEALARWRHPERGEVSPAAFIPLAEETGLIGEFGLWVLAQGCLQVAQWRAFEPGMRLNVNVSARQVMSPEFVGDVEKTLADVGLPPLTLTLELTESVLLGDPDEARVRLRELKDLGVRLSIDDFGTGYSSLSYLRRFPFDQLKIDRDFVVGITRSSDQLAVTRTVMELGKTLRLETVAEGIEEVAQLETLREIGCDLGQGFHLARPMEPSEVPEFFSRPSARA